MGFLKQLENHIRKKNLSIIKKYHARLECSFVIITNAKKKDNITNKKKLLKPNK